MVDVVTYRWPDKWKYISTNKVGNDTYSDKSKNEMADGVYYDDRYVDNLHAGIAKYLTIPHKIVHFDETTGFADPFPGWFQLMSFMGRSEPFLFITLDCVLVNNIDDLVRMGRENGCLTCSPCVTKKSNPNTNAVWVEGCQEYHELFKSRYHADTTVFSDTQNNYSAQPWEHDEDFIIKEVPYKLYPREWRLSYRMSEARPPEDSVKFINFHGLPKPHQAIEGYKRHGKKWQSDWLKEYWHV